MYFHMKLEQKHQALEAEKMESEMRNQEEEEAAIKELRKSMVVKAHPVPSFYREGPPPNLNPKSNKPLNRKDRGRAIGKVKYIFSS
ncbi:hypothetical protein R6Q59_000475 [Mikania micrantha]